MSVELIITPKYAVDRPMTPKRYDTKNTAWQVIIEDALNTLHHASLGGHTSLSFNPLILPSGIVVWISDTFDNIFGIKKDFTKYLKKIS